MSIKPGIKAFKGTIMERLEISRCSHSDNDNMSVRNALSRSKILFAGKFYRMDTLFCGSKGKSSSASFIFGMLNKIRSKCTIRFHYVPVAGHHVSSIVSLQFVRPEINIKLSNMVAF